MSPSNSELGDVSGTPVEAQAVLLDLGKIEAVLTTREIGKAPNFANELWQTIDSTNNRAMALAKQGAPHGVIVMSRQQTAGRGRLGRTWISPPDAGIYLSFLLRPAKFKPQIPLVTLATGFACAKAINKILGIKIGIKWINDLVLSGRKLGGILGELYLPPAPEQAAAEALIVGIGINIDQASAGAPIEVSSQMAWLTEVVQGSLDRNALVAEIAFELEGVIELLSAGRSEEILNGWRNYAVTLGELVVATVGNETVSGIAVDVSDCGGLILQTTAGQRTLHAGEVTLRTADGTYD